MTIAQVESLGFPFTEWGTVTGALASRRRGLGWLQGEHLIVIGETGSGKTTLLSQILDIPAYVVVFVTKTYDDSFSRKRWPNWHIMRQWNPREAAHHGHVLLWPKAGATIAETVDEQKRVFGDALNRIYRDRGWTVVVDELQWVVDELKLGREMRTYQHQARSSGITVVSGMQRPSHVPVITYGSATHAFVSRQVERDDVKRLADLGGIDAKVLAQALPVIPDRHWLYMHKGSKTPTVLTKVEV